MHSLIPDLESRFLQPDGWHKGYFTNPDTGHHIHYGHVSPQDPPKGAILFLPGLSEFSEKSYELAHNIIDRGFSFWTLDWAFQGRSNRFEGNPHKRHSDGFDSDISDLHFYLTHHIQKSSPHIPCYLMAHSTGCLIGLHHLAKYPHQFQSGILSAPLLGIYGVSNYPEWLTGFLLKILSLWKNSYVPGGSNWKAAFRPSDGSGIFSSDPLRDQIHNAWSLSDPSLQGGSPTIQWLIEAMKAMKKMRDPNLLKKINIPLLIAIAEKEKIVFNKATRKIIPQLQQAELIELKNAKHEILMETDDIRDEFLMKFDNLIANS